MTTFYITGLTGFVGKNVLNILNNEDNCKIVAFVLPNEAHIEFIQRPNITLIEGNLLNIDDVRRFLGVQGTGKKVLIHIAGRVSTFKKGDPLTMKINYEGTKNIVDALNEVGGFDKFVYVSSVDSLPKCMGNAPIKEVSYYDENLVEGVYSKSKALANNYILENCTVDTSIVLPSAIMGPDDPNVAPINNAIKRFINHKLPAITRGGYNIVDVRDVASGILKTVELGKDKESYLLTGKYVSVKELIRLAAEVSNMKPVRFKVPHFLIKLISPFIEHSAKKHRKSPLFTGFSMDCLLQNSNFSYEKAHSEFNYEPIDLKTTMIDTISWMKSSGYLSK